MRRCPGSGANNIPPIVGRDARQQPPLLISADTPPVAITPLTQTRNVKFRRYWTHHRVKVYSSTSRLCRWNVQWWLVGVSGADTVRILVILSSYYHITASISPCCSCSVANAGCVCRDSILPIIHTANLIQNYLDQMVSIRVWSEFSKFFIDHTSIYSQYF